MRKHRNAQLSQASRYGRDARTQLPNRAWRRGDPVGALRDANTVTLTLIQVAAALVGPAAPEAS